MIHRTEQICSVLFWVKVMNHRDKKGGQSSLGMIASTVAERALE